MLPHKKRKAEKPDRRDITSNSILNVYHTQEVEELRDSDPSHFLHVRSFNRNLKEQKLLDLKFMASISLPSTYYHSRNQRDQRVKYQSSRVAVRLIVCQQDQNDESTQKLSRSGTKPNYLGVQKNPPGLALCPATNNCISTSENTSDLVHYAPPWNYNPEEGRGRKKPVSKEVAMEELVQVIESAKADKSKPRIVERTDDYIHVEYESPIIGLVDDVEFWFPPVKKPIVQYRSASRKGNFDFDANRKRIKALRLELEKKGWASEDSF